MSEKSLCGIPGIGEKLAERTVTGRPYDRVEWLRKIYGIGEKRFKEIQRRIICVS